MCECVTCEVFKGIVGPGTHNSDFAEEWKRDPVNTPHKAVDLFVTAGFLLSELITWERQHVKVVRSKILLQLLQVLIVLLCVATLTRYIYHQGDLTHIHLIIILQLQSNRTSILGGGGFKKEGLDVNN